MLECTLTLKERQLLNSTIEVLNNLRRAMPQSDSLRYNPNTGEYISRTQITEAIISLDIILSATVQYDSIAALYNPSID